jgi:SAM-dependent methyltransferase
MTEIANTEQLEHWNSAVEIRHWVDLQARYDKMLEPFAKLILDAAQIAPGENVLDVGCGCGATTRAAARIATPGQVVGVDLSAPMLERGRQDAAAAAMSNVRFLQADAQVHRLETGHFDAVISRFGVMFFDDPVAAFGNLRSATRASGRLSFVCWRPMVENAWLLVPGAALAQYVPLPGLGAPDVPGMFAFADPDRVRSVLGEAGWVDLQVEPAETTMLVGGDGSVRETVEFLRTGSMGRTLLAGADAETEEKAIAAVTESLTTHADDEGVRMGAAVWVVTARA